MHIFRIYGGPFILGALAVVGLAWLVYAQVILAIVNVVPPGSCIESDGGFNLQQAGCISGSFSFNLTNGTLPFNGTFCEARSPSTGNQTNGTQVIELVCGQNIAPQYSGLAGAVLVPCPTGPGVQGICVRGRCV